MTEPDAKPATFTRLRALIFLLLALAIGVVLIVAMTWFVIGSAPRSTAVAVADGVTVSEFVTLPDDDAYPAALAIDADGTLYTGSYASGAIWSISPDGDRREILDSRELIGSVSGLDVGPDGALYILDRLTALNAEGGIVWIIQKDELRSLFEVLPIQYLGGPLVDDIAVDNEGRIYISDRLGHVLRFSRSGEPLGRDDEVYWWFSPCGDKCEITGIAYDRDNDELLIADPADEAVYRVEITDGRPGEVRTIFRGSDTRRDFGFDGVTVTAEGDIYIALLNWNHVAQLVDGELVMLAKDFRGASDVAYDAPRNRLYVANWNQFSLGFGTRPQLPFALDVIDLSPSPEQTDA